LTSADWCVYSGTIRLEWLAVHAVSRAAYYVAGLGLLANSRLERRDPLL